MGFNNSKKQEMSDRKIIYLDDALDALCDNCDNAQAVCAHYPCKQYTAIDALTSAQPETCKEKLKEIADALSEKFAYMNTCLNERDIILSYLGVERPNKIHCNTDCTNIKCEIHRCNKRLPSAQPEIIRCKNCEHWRQQTNYQGILLPFGFCESDDMWRSLYGETYEVSHIDTDEDFYCGYAERRTYE